MRAGGDASIKSGRPFRRETSTRSRWTLTQSAFDKLLACLDADRETAGSRYVEIRANLIRFFEWRGCPFPEDHADETINRVARRVAEGEEIRNPAAYFLGVGRMVLLEVYKDRDKKHRALSDLAYSHFDSSSLEDLEPQIECLKRCLEGQSPDNRELILEYYQGEKSAKIGNRRKLSERLNIPLNTLRMRALRVRERLQECVAECLKSYDRT